MQNQQTANHSPSQEKKTEVEVNANTTRQRSTEVLISIKNCIQAIFKRDSGPNTYRFT